MQSSVEHYLGNEVLGIDLGTTSAKLLVLSQSGARNSVSAAGSFGIAQTQSGALPQPKETGKSVAQYLEENGITCKNCIFSVPSHHATLRNITLPQLSGEELNEAAKFKVKRHLPFSVDDAYVEVSDRQPGDRDENQCLVIAVPKAVIDSRAEALVWAGLNPVRAELEGQAILRVVEQKLSRKGALWRDASLTIIDVGATFTHMYVVQNQRLQFIRGVKFGSESLYRAVATRMEVTVAEAVALVDGPNTKLSPEGVLGFQGEREIALVDLSAELDRLLREVQRLMRYFRSLHAERSYAGILDHAVLCGGFVGLSGFGEFLERNLQLKVEHARPIAGLMTRFNQETFNSVSNRQEAYTVVMGLAMSGIDRDQAVWGGAETSEFRWTRTG